MVTAIEWWTDASYSSDMVDKAQEHNADHLSLLQLQDSHIFGKGFSSAATGLKGAYAYCR